MSKNKNSPHTRFGDTNFQCLLYFDFKLPVSVCKHTQYSSSIHRGMMYVMNSLGTKDSCNSWHELVENKTSNISSFSVYLNLYINNMRKKIPTSIHGSIQRHGITIIIWLMIKQTSQNCFFSFASQYFGANVFRLLLTMNETKLNLMNNRETCTNNGSHRNNQIL